MPARNSLKSVLQGFLGTFRSRNSDHHGFWIFGLVVSELSTKSIDLLANDVDGDPAAILSPLARSRFREQLAKHGLPTSYVHSARLRLQRVGTLGRPSIDIYIADGNELLITVRATTDLGKTYASNTTLFAAPHDPRRERRSTRADGEK